MDIPRFLPIRQLKFKKSVVFPVIKTQNNTLLDELSAILTFFAFKDEKTEFVKLIFWLYNKCWGVQQIELEKNKNFQKSRAYLFKILYNGIVEKP